MQCSVIGRTQHLVWLPGENGRANFFVQFVPFRGYMEDQSPEAKRNPPKRAARAWRLMGR
jgi:hypothetical protein